MLGNNQNKTLSQKIFELTTKEISLLIKSEDFNKGQIKIRLFNPRFILTFDRYVNDVLLTDELLLKTITELEFKICEQIELKKKEIENRKKANKKKFDAANLEAENENELFS